MYLGLDRASGAKSKKKRKNKNIFPFFFDNPVSSWYILRFSAVASIATEGYACTSWAATYLWFVVRDGFLVPLGPPEPVIGLWKGYFK